MFSFHDPESLICIGTQGTEHHTTNENATKTKVIDGVEYSGGACRGRTYDKRIKSPLLYQLS